MPWQANTVVMRNRDLSICSQNLLQATPRLLKGCIRKNAEKGEHQDSQHGGSLQLMPGLQCTSWAQRHVLQQRNLSISRFQDIDKLSQLRAELRAQLKPRVGAHQYLLRISGGCQPK